MADRLNIPRKLTGDLLTAEEFNAVVDAINALQDGQLLLERAFEVLREQIGAGTGGRWLSYRGTTTAALLPAASIEREGWVYAVTGLVITRDDFTTGSGSMYENGVWVACVMREQPDGSVAYLWDILPDVMLPGGPATVDSLSMATEEDIRRLFSDAPLMAVDEEGWQLGVADALLMASPADGDDT